MMSEGKSFHMHAPATGKARRPTVESLTAGTNRLSMVEVRSLSSANCLALVTFRRSIEVVQVVAF